MPDQGHSKSPAPDQGAQSDGDDHGPCTMIVYDEFECPWSGMISIHRVGQLLIIPWSI